VIDPVQWWGALTQQFAQLAASALKDSAATPRAAPQPRPRHHAARRVRGQDRRGEKVHGSTASSKTPAARRAAKPR